MAFQWNQVFKTLSRFSIQLLLLGFFIFFFGEPAVRQYIDKKVLVVRTRQNSKGTPAPAVTMVVRNLSSNIGWKEEGQLGSAGFVQKLCKDANTTDTFTSCIHKNTYNFSEIIKSVKIGSNDFNSSRKVKGANWKEDFTHIYAGRAYTIDHPVNLKVNSPSDNALYIALANFGLTYEIYIHDQDFFYITRNPESGHPNIRLWIDLARKGSIMYSIAVTEVEESNVPDDPCNEDPKYNFRRCLKESFLRKVGCKTKWDEGTLDEGLPLCATQEHFM